MSSISYEAFLNARLAVLGESAHEEGIGALGEKCLHRILKYYISEDPATHEIRLSGKITDVYLSGMAYEIQTRGIERLRPKLVAFLDSGISATVVLPVITERTVRWLDTETGDISEPRKSPKHENIYTALASLYPIRDLISRGASVRLISLAAEDFRYLNGRDKTKKRGSTRMERIPTVLVGDITLGSPEDYVKILPKDLPRSFTSLELSRCASVPKAEKSSLAGVFFAVGAIEREGRNKNGFIYKRSLGYVIKNIAEE